MNEHKRAELLLLFLTLAEQLSFTKAAKTLGISKGHLSEKIKLLEQHLKTPLLIRTTRNVRLTLQGEYVYGQALNIRKQLFDIEKTIDSQEISGVLKLTAPKMFTNTYLIDVCRKFKQIYTDIEFVINSSYKTYNLNQQDFDLAFRATVTPPDNMVATELFDYEHIIVASPLYLESKGTPQSLHDLNTHKCLTVTGQNHWPFNDNNINIKGWLSSNDNEFLKQHAITNGGLIRIADYFVKDELQRGQLKEVLTRYKIKNSGRLFMLHPQLITPPLKLRVFKGFMNDYFKLINEAK